MEKLTSFTHREKLNIKAKLPLIELAGTNRVLIENHQGVMAYSTCEIQIKVSYGCVTVKGSNLQLLEMSRIQLVICGSIEGLQLLGR